MEGVKNCGKDNLKIMPPLERYEQCVADKSLVISNHSRIETGLYLEAPPPVPPYKPAEESEVAIYEEVGTQAMMSSTKEADNVQLMSIRGMSEFLQSPTGAPVEMKAIHSAAANGNKRALREILSQLPIRHTAAVGTSDYTCALQGIDERDGKGRTALMHAVHNNHTQCVQLLVENGANTNAVSYGRLYACDTVDNII